MSITFGVGVVTEGTYHTLLLMAAGGSVECMYVAHVWVTMIDQVQLCAHSCNVNVNNNFSKEVVVTAAKLWFVYIRDYSY